jgi:hypothetical protein
MRTTIPRRISQIGPMIDRLANVVGKYRGKACMRSMVMH